MTEPEPIKCSDQMVQVVLEGVREVIDHDEISAVLASGGISNFDDQTDWTLVVFKAFLSGMEIRHGRLGLRGFAVRVGQASFPELVKAYGSDGGFEEPEYRLLPVRKRARVGLEKIAAIFNCACHLRVAVDSEPDAWVWTIADCPLCNDPQVESAVSHFMLGLLQAYFSWISGGKMFLIEEKACMADGAPSCIIHIHRLPID